MDLVPKLGKEKLVTGWFNVLGNIEPPLNVKK